MQIKIVIQVNVLCEKGPIVRAAVLTLMKKHFIAQTKEHLHAYY